MYSASTAMDILAPACWGAPMRPPLIGQVTQRAARVEVSSLVGCGLAYLLWTGANGSLAITLYGRTWAGGAGGQRDGRGRFRSLQATQIGGEVQQVDAKHAQGQSIDHAARGAAERHHAEVGSLYHRQQRDEVDHTGRRDDGQYTAHGEIDDRWSGHFRTSPEQQAEDH